MCLFRGKVEMAELDLAVCPCHFERTVHHMKIVILVRQGEGFLARSSHCRCKVDGYRRTRCNAHSPAKTQNWIQTRPCGTRDFCARIHSRGARQSSSAANEAPAIRFELLVTDHGTIHRNSMNRPDGLFICRTRPAKTDQCVVRDGFGLQ